MVILLKWFQILIEVWFFFENDHYFICRGPYRENLSRVLLSAIRNRAQCSTAIEMIMQVTLNPLTLVWTWIVLVEHAANLTTEWDLHCTSNFFIYRYMYICKGLVCSVCWTFLVLYVTVNMCNQGPISRTDSSWASYHFVLDLSLETDLSLFVKLAPGPVFTKRS